MVKGHAARPGLDCAFALKNVMLNLQLWHCKIFPTLSSVVAPSQSATNSGYGLVVLSNVVKDQIISWYAKGIISMKEATELKAQGNRHIQIVKCLVTA